MMRASQVRYSRLATSADEVDLGKVTEDQASPFEFSSAFTYNDDTGVADNADFKSINKYNSAFKYRDAQVNIRIRDDDVVANNTSHQPAFWLVATTWFLTFMSYLFFILTIPVSYWIMVKKMGEFDRLVVFRLGKLIGVKGPGRFVIFPWMDRTKKIDVRAAAFSVPPQQFITVDGGIVEMGAEIQYGIVDVVTMISEVADHQDILRSLGKTLLIKILVRKTVHQLERDKRTPANEILDEINDQVRKWGINVHSVTLSETKILKQPESGSNAAVGSILKGLGMKSEPKYPTPQEFIRASQGLEEQETASMMSLPPASLGNPMNMNLLQGLSLNMPPGANTSQVQLGPGVVQAKAPESPPGNWGQCLEIIIGSELSHNALEDDAHGMYQLEITETGGEGNKEVYFIELSGSVKYVGSENQSGREPDVFVSISSSDLGNVLEGSLAPLQAYLTGRITATGDVRKLMFFDKLSKRGHKPGSMFSV